MAQQTDVARHEPLLHGSPNWFKYQCADIRHQNAHQGRPTYRDAGRALWRIAVESSQDENAWDRLKAMYDGLPGLPGYSGDYSPWFPPLGEFLARELPGCWKLIPARKREMVLDGVAEAIAADGI